MSIAFFNKFGNYVRGLPGISTGQSKIDFVKKIKQRMGFSPNLMET